MPERYIDDLVPNENDPGGNLVICIYIRKPPDYAVYRTPLRVMVQFADDRKVAEIQRSALAALNPLRGQISGLIDGWHSSKRPNVQSRAMRYDRRVADAIVAGLEGSIADALALLKEIRDDIVAERKSIAQTDYLLWAASAAILFILVVAVLSAPDIHLFRNAPKNARLIWTAAAGGSIGAFFSVATALRGRSILIDLQQRDNRRDALLRMAVGTIGAAILACLLMTGLVTLGSIGGKDLASNGNDAVLIALVIGFLAGFSERAVPDILGKASAALGDTKEGDVAGDQAKAAAAPAAQAAAAAAVAADAAAAELAEPPVDPATEAVDDSLCDSPPVEGEPFTADEDLPVAVGGVSADVLAPPAPNP